MEAALPGPGQSESGGEMEVGPIRVNWSDAEIWGAREDGECGSDLELWL